MLLQRFVQEHQVDVRATAMCIAQHPVETRPVAPTSSKTQPKSILKQQEIKKSITKKPKQSKRSTNDTIAKAPKSDAKKKKKRIKVSE